MSPEKPRLAGGKRCVICEDPIEDKEEIAPCHHRYHRQCLFDWKSQGHEVCFECKCLLKVRMEEVVEDE